MLYFLQKLFKTFFLFFTIIVNTLFWSICIIIVAIFKLLIPVQSWRCKCSKVLNNMASQWIFFNNLNFDLVHNINWEIRGIENVKGNDTWYLILANHQTWVDIFVLQKIFHRKIPFIKFFIKKELFWIPIIGFTWWALDFPFVRRYPKRIIDKKPHLKGKDIETTKKACEQFKNTPISIMNFVEGTRFTNKKHKKQNSPYSNLLKPKASGTAFVINAMSDYIDNIINVTIVYPEGPKNFIQFLSGDVKNIKVDVEVLQVDKQIAIDYFKGHEFRMPFYDWLNDLWAKKDNRINNMIT